MKKRVFSLALALCMALALLPSAALAADSDFKIEDGVLIEYTGPGGDVVIPSSVTTIDRRAFYLRGSLTSVTIPDSVTSIGDSAFYGCSGLTSITIPNSVTSIGNDAFLGCDSLTSVTIPSSVTSIGACAFANCEDLTSIAVEPGNPNYMSEDGVLFSKDKTELHSYPAGKSGDTYNIPSGVTSIGDRAFISCGLTSVTIPFGVTRIGNDAFRNCQGLTGLAVPYGVTTIGAGAFAFSYSLTRISIPSSVASIGQDAFETVNIILDIYYGGSWTDWERITAGEHMHNVSMHYNSAEADAVPVAHASAQTVLVDGIPVEFQMYALWDSNGNPTNYIKLRDLAYILNGTAARFEVSWDAASASASLLPGQPYTPTGSEMNTPFSGDRACKPSTAAVLVNGAPVSLDAFTLTDGSGGEYNYYKLRDLGQALDFNVSWADGQVVVNTGQPYDAG